MGLKTIDVVAVFLLNLIQYGSSDHILPCNGTSLDECREHQICSLPIKECVCLKGYVRVGDDCAVPSAESSSHSVTIAIVTILTLVLLIVGAILVVRKYNLVDYVRQKMNSRQGNDVMYEDVMIGNDDPPLSP